MGSGPNGIIFKKRKKMNIVRYPDKGLWKELLSRPALSVEGLYERVQAVLDKVRNGGDAALREFELQFDKVELESLAVSQAELDEAASLVPADLRDATIHFTTL